MSLSISNITVRFDSTTAVDCTSAQFSPGEMVALIGPNGAGKSSLIRAIAGAIDYEGSVQWRGQAFGQRPGTERARCIAYLPQSASAHWPISVRELVALGRLPHRRFGQKPSSEEWAIVDLALERTATAHLASRAVTALSGGEHARVQLARALAVNAPVLLVDEPIAMLDPYHQLQIMQLLREQAGRGTIVVAVLHDLTLAARFCHRSLMIQDGRIVADGSPERVLSHAQLVSTYGVEPHIHEFDGQQVVIPWRHAP